MSHAETCPEHSRKNAQKAQNAFRVGLCASCAFLRLRKNVQARSLQLGISQYDIGPTSHCEVIQANRAGRPGEWPRTTYIARTQESFRFDGGI